MATLYGASTCPRCGALAEVFDDRGRHGIVGHCASRLCAAWFSLPDPDLEPNSQEIP